MSAAYTGVNSTDGQLMAEVEKPNAPVEGYFICGGQMKQHPHILHGGIGSRPLISISSIEICHRNLYDWASSPTVPLKGVLLPEAPDS
jgi:hypothetical protein